MQQADAIIAGARACRGTPFVPQGRLPGVGLDCAGLVIAAYAAADIPIAAPADYAFPPPSAVLLDSLHRAGFVRTDKISPAALLLFRFGGTAQHLALTTGSDSMIHAYAPAGRVVETAIGAAWRPRLLGIYCHSQTVIPAKAGIHD